MGKIYTKTGDKGTTSLMNGQRVPKYALRVEAYGTVDELCSLVGIIVAKLDKKDVLQKDLIAIQKDLFEIESLLSDPSGKELTLFLTALTQRIPQLELSIDAMTKELPDLTNFILPGGTEVAATLQFARTVCRRAERIITRLSQEEAVNEILIKYLNRLSDLFFTQSRYVNLTANQQETIWSEEK